MNKLNTAAKYSFSAGFCMLFTLMLTLVLSGALPSSAFGVTEDNAAHDSSTATTKTLLSASEPAYPPFCIVNDNNKADGFSVELLRATLNRMGHKASFKIGAWDNIKAELAQGKLDVLPLVGRTPEREEIFDFTFPYMTMHGSIVVRSEEQDIRSITDLQGKRVGVMKSDNAEEYVNRINLDAKINTTDTFKNALIQLANGNFDAVIMQRLPALELINRLNLANLKITGPPLDGFTQSLSFAVQKGNSELLSILNEGLAIAIADGTFNHLHTKWFSAPGALSSRRIKVGGDHNFPPYEFINANGEPDGFNIDMVRAVAEKLDINIDIQLGPWAEIVSALENESIDLLAGMFYSSQRDQRFNFSAPHTLVSHVIVSRKKAPEIDNLAQLNGVNVAVQRGDIMHDKALELGYTDNLVLAQSQEECFDLVAYGDVDYALMSRLSALYWIQHSGAPNLRLSEQSVVTPEYCFATSHREHHLLQIFSHGLSELKATGTYREIRQKWLEPLEEDGIDQYTFFKYSLFIAGPVLALLSFSLLWTYTLRKRVAQQTLALQTQTNERIKAEEKLHQKFKMEAIGIMAGGIAHNFNNNLAIILASLDLARHERNNPDKVERLLANARTATLRSRHLVQQILTYSHHGSTEKKPLDLANVVEETVTLARSTIPTSVAIKLNIAADAVSAHTYANEGQIQEAILNLCNNAVHAMDEKGEIDISLDIAWIETEFIPDPYECEGGRFLRLMIQDNGCGMEQDLLDKIFDPFFTTKEVGQGTGMGLATVQGMIKQHGGFINVTSSPGVGSAFELYFPLLSEHSVTEAETKEHIQPTGGQEKILVVDDEEILAALLEEQLESLGYEAASITSSSEALDLFRANPDHFDLVISDQTMPELTGVEMLTHFK
ncbi:MAG: transporter substrate-binding domain-containing protein, partial [Geobacteraceae bacterium]|nr:transporter substrate-binding domain-containing protein [Geobacteraceae bacterium]